MISKLRQWLERSLDLRTSPFMKKSSQLHRRRPNQWITQCARRLDIPCHRTSDQKRSQYSESRKARHKFIHLFLRFKTTLMQCNHISKRCADYT